MQHTLAIDLGAFVVLFVFSALVRRGFKHNGYSDTATGGIVMSTGIFVAFAFTQFPFDTSLVARLFTAEIFVVWLFLAGSFFTSALEQHFRMHYAHPLRRFAVGTWVAGTAVLAALVAKTMPEVMGFARVLAVIAVLIYLPYVVLFVRGYIHLWRHPFTQKANGVILLATVSTQSIVIALYATFGEALPDEVALGLIAFDVAFVVSGLLLIALHFHDCPIDRLGVEWKNANCIVHGGLSIIGLALVLATDFGATVELGLWQVTLTLFCIIETLEVIRLIQRVRRRGVRRGVLVYNVTQWTRNFTFGMFYAFSYALYHHYGTMPSASGNALLPIVKFVVDWGQYVVLADLLVELAIMLRARLYRHRDAGVIRLQQG